MSVDKTLFLKGIVWEESFLEGEGYPESVKIFENLRCNSVK